MSSASLLKVALVVLSALLFIVLGRMFRCALAVVASCPVCGRDFRGRPDRVWDAVDHCVASHRPTAANMLF
jgi:hypothetical protein